MANENEQASREREARLHELVYGTRPEMRAAYRDPETGRWEEEQSRFEREIDDPWKREIQAAQLEGIIREAREGINHGILHAMQPCAPCILREDLSSDWRAPFVGWTWDVVPHYTTDHAAIWEALSEFIKWQRFSVRIEDCDGWNVEIISDRGSSSFWFPIADVYADTINAAIIDAIFEAWQNRDKTQ